jgi:hypothetical protein
MPATGRVATDAIGTAVEFTFSDRLETFTTGSYSA